MSKTQILISEDDAITAMDIENQLKNLGYDVSAKVANGEDAIKKIKENTPDLVLMDIVLKGEMDGIEAADEIRSQFDIPVVFLTAYADRKRLERAKLTTPFGFIIKPFQDKDLRVTIEMALYVAKVDAERKQAEEALRESEERYRALFKYNPVATIIVDNKAKITMYNFAKEISRGRLPNIGDVMYKEYAGKHQINMFEQLMECIKSGEQKEFVELKYKERFLNIRISPFSGGAIITSIDTTDRRLAEDALRREIKERK